ncbi:transposase [Endozoicomonas sp.]
MAGKKGIRSGIFTALHTFGRDLKWNTHVHLSVTTGGLAKSLEDSVFL